MLLWFWMLRARSVVLVRASPGLLGCERDAQHAALLHKAPPKHLACLQTHIFYHVLMGSTQRHKGSAACAYDTHVLSAIGTICGTALTLDVRRRSRQPLAGDLELAQVISRQLLRDAVGRRVRLKQYIPSREAIAVPITLQKVSQSADGRRHEVAAELVR